MESYSVVAVLSATDKNFSSTMNSANNSMNSLDGSAEKTRSSILKIAGTAVAVKAVDIATNALKSSLDGAISRYDTMNRFPRVMEQIGFSTDESNASIERLSEGIDGLPTSLDGITASTQSIALLTGDLDSATETALALNNAFLASGSSTADASRGLTQYSQMLSKGKVDMQSWYTLQETMGYALKETAIQLGITSGNTNELYSALQSGSITFDQFNAALIECSTRTGGFAEVAKTASAGIGTSFQNLQTAVVKNVTNIISATDQMLADNDWGTLAGNIDNAKGVINTAGSAIAKSIGVAGKAVKGLSPVLKVGATGWLAYEAAMGISNTIKKTNTAISAAQSAIKIATSETVKMSSALTVGGKAAQTVTTQTRAMTLVLTASQKATALKTAAEAKGYSVNAAGQVVTAKGVALTAAETSQLAASTGAVTAKTLAVGVLTGQVTLAQAATAVWNAVLAANPIVLVVTAVAALAAGIVVLNKAFGKGAIEAEKLKKEQEALTDSAKELNSAVDSSRKTRKSNIESLSAESAATKDVVNKIVELAAKKKKTASETQTLTSYIDVLNSSVDGLNLSFSEETNSLNMSIQAIREKVKSYQQLAEAAAYQEMLTEALTEQKKIEMELQEVQKQTKDIAEVDLELLRGKVDLVQNNTKAEGELIEEEKRLQEQLANNKEEVTALTNAMSESMATQSSAVSSSVETQVISFENLSDSAESALDRVVAAYETMTSGLTGLNNELKLDSETTWAKVQENQEKALSYTQEFAELYAQAIDAGVSESYLNAIGATGPEALPLLRGMMKDGWSEVLNSQSEWESAYKTIGDTFANTLEIGDAGRAAISEYVTGSAGILGTLQSQIDSADFSGTGAKIGEGFLNGVKTGAPLANDAMKEMVDGMVDIADAVDFTTPAQKWATDMATSVTEGGAEVKEAMTGVGTDATAGYAAGVESGTGAITGAAHSAITAGIEAAKAAQSSNSPSVVYQGLGTDAIDGYVLGVEGSQGTIASVMSAAMQTGVDAAESTLSSGLGSAVSSAGKSFNQLGGYALAGMSGMNAAINSGAATAKTSFNQIPTSAKGAMSATNAAVNAGMSTSARTVVSSMQSINTAIKSGYTTAQNTTKTSMTGMTNSTKSGFTSIASVGKSGMSSFASAIAAGMNTANSRVASGNASMIAKVRTLQSSFYSSGAYASQGLANGINARAGAAIAAAQSVANRVAAIMASALQERSPSRVTRKIGAYASEGLAIGLKEELGSVEKASQLVANAISNIIEPSLGDMSDRLAFAGDFSYAAENLLNHTSNNTFEVYVVSELDGRKVGYGTATYTQEQIEKQTKRNNRRAGIRE